MTTFIFAGQMWEAYGLGTCQDSGGATPSGVTDPRVHDPHTFMSFTNGMIYWCRGWDWTRGAECDWIEISEGQVR